MCDRESWEQRGARPRDGIQCGGYPQRQSLHLSDARGMAPAPPNQQAVRPQMHGSHFLAAPEVPPLSALAELPGRLRHHKSLDASQPLMDTAKYFYTGNASPPPWNASPAIPSTSGTDPHNSGEAGPARSGVNANRQDTFAIPAFQSTSSQLGNTQKQPVMTPVPAGRVHREEQASPVSQAGPESLGALIKVCAHNGDVARMEELLLRRADVSAELSVETYNSIIHTCTQAGDMVRVEQYMRRMEESGFSPNLITYNSVINACAALGDAAQAEKWLMHMISKGMQPNHVTYGTICKVFARQGGVDQVQGIMKLLEGSGTPLNEYFYASLISACGAANPPDLQRAESALIDLARRGLRPQSVKRALARVVGDARTVELFRNLRRLSASGPASSQGSQSSGHGQVGAHTVPTDQAGGLPCRPVVSPERHSGRGAAGTRNSAPRQDRGRQGSRGGRAIGQACRAHGCGTESFGGKPVAEDSRRGRGRGRGLGKAGGKRTAAPHPGAAPASGRVQSYVPGAMLFQAARSADAPNLGSAGTHDVLHL
mmetsp:Transcript_15084/g.44012  ORF Transcript_15084/g.44012 Transcript_15084/m.44012 type:complete len:542 (-) Transcript_15084:99-1724(-)